MENNYNRYKIEKKINEDQYSKTYKAYDTSLNRNISLKKYKDYDYFYELNNRFKSISELNHPNIFKIYDIEFDNKSNLGILTYEFCNGISLSDYLSRKDFKFDLIIEILKKVLLALIYLNNNNIQYGKIYSDNIIINNSVDVKLKGLDTIPENKSYNQIYYIKDFLKEVLLSLINNTNLNNNYRMLVDKFLDRIYSTEYNSTPEILNELNLLKTDKVESIKDSTILFNAIDENSYNNKISYRVDEPSYNDDRDIYKENKARSIIKSILVYLSSIMLAFVVAVAFIFYYHSRPKAPDYTGKNLELVINTANTDGIQIVVDKSLNVDTSNLSNYVVLSQNPKKGDTLLISKKIKVTIGIEKNKTMINLVGMNLEKAKQELFKLGVNIKRIKYKKNSIYKKSIIIEQSIEAGKLLNTNDSIILTVSSGKIERDNNSDDQNYIPPEENKRPSDESDQSNENFNESIEQDNTTGPKEENQNNNQIIENNNDKNGD